MNVHNSQNHNSIYTKPAVCISLAILCCLLWGSAFPCIKAGYEWLHITSTGSMILFAGYRFTLAGIMTLAFAMITDAPSVKLPRRLWLPVCAQGLLQTTMEYAFFYIGLAYTTGSKGSVLSSTSAFFTILIAPFVFKSDRISFQKGLACILGFAGVIMLNSGSGGFLGEFTLAGEGAVLLSSASLGAGNVTSKILAEKASPVAITAWQLIAGGLVLIGIGFGMGGSITGFDLKSMVLLIYMAFLSSVAFSVWTILIKYNTAGKISVYSFTIPIFGVILSAVFLGESFLSVKNIAALALVCMGVIVLNIEKKHTTIENRTYHKNSILRISLAALIVVLQIGLLILMIAYLDRYAAWIELAIQVIALFLVVRIYSEEKNASMKMPWIILILILPVMGVSLYYLIGGNIGTYVMRRRFNKVDSELLNYRFDDSQILEEIRKTDKEEYGISRYISRCSGYPVYKESRIEYFGDTSDALQRLLQDLSQAEHFIFMEYFAIENNLLWEKILQVLEDRVSAGVEVRILYDDVGSIGYVGPTFQKMMKEKGIRCRIFNRISAVFNKFMNNRDHRKITVIDGKTGYTGGFNMADEYFNISHPYGLWKDAGIRIEGKAVNSLTAAFLEMWNTPIKNENERDQDISRFLKAESCRNGSQDSFVQPYGDSPLDHVRIGEDVYLSMVEKASSYCYFMTPYLIITDEMIRAMTLAAERGVDVRIIVPGIPDKKVVYSVTRSFYNGLVVHGVKIYEWTPGFLHSKLCLVDGKMATCGSINLDYRSLYHHFEFGCFFNDKNVIASMEQDFQKTFSESTDVSEKYRSTKYSRKFRQKILRLFAELL